MKGLSCPTAVGGEHRRRANLTTSEHLCCALVGFIDSGFVGISLEKKKEVLDYSLKSHSLPESTQILVLWNNLKTSRLQNHHLCLTSPPPDHCYGLKWTRSGGNLTWISDHFPHWIASAFWWRAYIIYFSTLGRYSTLNDFCGSSPICLTELNCHHLLDPSRPTYPAESV